MIYANKQKKSTKQKKINTKGKEKKKKNKTPKTERAACVPKSRQRPTSTAKGYGAAAFSLFSFTGSVACIKGIKMLLYKIKVWARETDGGRAVLVVPSGCRRGQPLIPDNDAIITRQPNLYSQHGLLHDRQPDRQT